MNPITIEYLTNSYKNAKELDYRFIGVRIEGNGVDNEIVIQSMENFECELSSYKKNCNKNLSHMVAKGIKITAFTFGDSLREIENNLSR